MRKCDIAGLQTYFTSVIDWVSSVFIRAPDREMRGLEWGRLYETYHSQSYNASKVDARVDELCADPAVRAAKGIYEYLLGGEKQTKLPNIRLFDDNMKRTAYTQQTKVAKAENVSNCPLCALGNDTNKTRIYAPKEMDADHVTAWSKGGATDLSNLTMLCQTPNRAKGNR
jgi:5-methylcytosine-specific restriction endonuclease McrA